MRRHARRPDVPGRSARKGTDLTDIPTGGGVGKGGTRTGVAVAWAGIMTTAFKFPRFDPFGFGSSRFRKQRPDFAVPAPCRAGFAWGPNESIFLPEPFREKAEYEENKGFSMAWHMQAVNFQPSSADAPEPPFRGFLLPLNGLCKAPKVHRDAQRCTEWGKILALTLSRNWAI